MLQQGGDHYATQVIQPIDYMRAAMTREQLEGYLRGNVIKYISRYDKKGTPTADLIKCKDYISALIQLQGEPK